MPDASLAAPASIILPRHARALRFEAFGGPGVLHLADVAVEAPGPDEALVAVRAASVNPSDVKNVAGRMRQTLPPRTPGRDYAGVVVAGPQAWLGAEVWGSGGDHGYVRDGSHAEYLRVPVAGLSRKPDALSFEQAAAVGVNYVTAWIGLDYAQLAANETVLVIGATGGVGGAACGIACGKQARVIAACRGALPADSTAAHARPEVIDLDAGDLGAQVAALTGGRGVDVVYDCVGRTDLTEAALGALAFRGRIIVIAGMPGEQVRFELIPFYRRECRILGVDTLKRGTVECAPMMEALRPGFEAGTYPAPAIAEAHPLERGAGAYASVARGTRGRVVITMR